MTQLNLTGFLTLKFTFRIQSIRGFGFFGKFRSGERVSLLVQHLEEEVDDAMKVKGS